MATLAITLSDLNLRACACLRVRGSAHLYLFVCPDGAHFRVLWFLRMCVILLVVGSNIRFCNRRRGGIKLLSLSFLTISPHFSSFFPLWFLCVYFLFHLPFLHSAMHILIWFTAPAINAAMPYVLWSVEGCLPVRNESLTQRHHIIALILAKTNMHVFGGRTWEEAQSERSATRIKSA